MSVDLEWYPFIFARLAIIGFGLWLVYLRPGSRPVLVLFSILTLLAAKGLSGALARIVDDPAQAAYWARVSPYFLFPAPFLSLYLATLYSRGLRGAFVRPAITLALAASLVVVEWLYVQDHALFRDEQGPGILSAFNGMERLGFATVALALALERARTEAAHRRKSLFLLSVGFIVYSLYHGIWDAGTELEFSHAGPFLGWLAHVLSVLLVGVAVAILSRQTRIGPETGPGLRLNLARPVLGGVTTAGLAVVGVHFMFSPEAAFRLGTLLDGLVCLMFPVILFYAIAIHQLFDIDLKVKWAVKQGTVAGAFLVVFVVVGVGAQSYLSANFGWALGGVASGALLLGLTSVKRMADGIAHAALPGVTGTAEYVARRKLEVYRAALEETAISSPQAIRDDPVLIKIRASLGITDEEHRILSLTAGGGRRRIAGSAALGNFEVERELGRGSGGKAFLARDKVLGRRVVLKQPLELSVHGASQRDLFIREARLLARVQHPNVVSLYQVIPEEDPPVLVMEYVEGENLAEILERRGRLEPQEVGKIALDVLAGLGRIHSEGVVHRDVKPANILIGKDGTAKIMDFGVAHSSDAWSTMTLAVAGFQPGSPRYMSPEQARGDTLDARSDLYSLGIVLEEALAGAASLAPRPPPVPPFDRVLAKALQPNPVDRFQTAEEMGEALRGNASRGTAGPRDDG